MKGDKVIETGYVMTIKGEEAKQLLEAFRDGNYSLDWEANDDGSLELYISK